MELDIISYHELVNPSDTKALDNLQTALLHKGIVGIRDYDRYRARIEK